MSIARKLFGGASESAAENTPTETNSSVQPLSDAVVSGLVWLETGPKPPAYDMTREQSYKFSETVNITVKEGDDIAAVTVQTPTTTMNFTVRINGYTSRFGELDVEYISVGGYALNLYHPLPDSDEYFVRRLYYYEDEDGVGAEQHRDNTSEPTSVDWSRENIGETVTIGNTDAHLTVYDWRQQMMTHNKPTPSEGEVVLRYQDSPNTGGNRSETDIVLTVTDIQFASGECITVDFIQFDVNTGEYVLYAPIDDGWAIGRVSANSVPNMADISWVTDTDSQYRPSSVENLVWVRDPADTWAIDNVQRRNSYI